MRVLIVDTCYPPFLSFHYERNPSLRKAPYATQWRALMDTFFGTADSYSYYLRELGHDACEVIANCEPLQMAWASEHGLRRQRLGALRRQAVFDNVVAAQVEDFAPDVLYMQNLSVLDEGLLRELGAGRLLVGQIATELVPEPTLRCFDLIVTALPQYVERLGDRGYDVELLRLAFDPRVRRRLGEVEVKQDVVFAGSLAGPQWRAAGPILESAAQRLPIDFYGFRTDLLPADSPIRTSYRGEAWGLDFYRVLASARIGLNRHGEVAEGRAANMRLYEATGVGTFLLTDERSDLHDLFEPGRELVTYADADDLVEQARYYLEHEDERSAISRAGQERTLREHTWEHRMTQVVDILSRRL
jgi:hypothetical protein